jgi:hypothetical protein
MYLEQFFSGMDDVEIMVLFFEELERPFFDLPRNLAVRCFAPRPVAYAFVTFLPGSLDYPPYLTATEANDPCGLSLRDLLFQCSMDNVKTFCFPSAHGDHVLFCHNALRLTSGIVTGNRTFLFW